MDNGVLCVSPNGADFSCDRTPASRLAVGTIDGVLLLERAGTTWSLSDHTLRGVHVGSLLQEESSGILFAGAHSGGLYASLDAGRTWEPRLEGLAHPHVYTLACQPHASSPILYAGTEPAHLYASVDLGRRWVELRGLREVPGAERWTFPAPPHHGHVKQVTFHPTDTRTLFVCIEQGALLRSHNSGGTWTEIESFHAPGRHRYYKDVHRLRISPTDPSRMYLTGGDGCFRTDDAGQSWHQMMDGTPSIGYPDDIHLDPRDPSRILVAGAAVDPASWPEAQSANASVLCSSDSGRHWERLGTGLPDPMHGHIAAMTMHAYGDTFELFIGTTDGELFASYDSGMQWELIGDGYAPVAKANHYIRLPKRSGSSPASRLS